MFYAREEGGEPADSLVTTISAELQQLAYTLINGQGRGVCCVANAVVKLYDTASVPFSSERGPDAPRCFLLRMELLEPVDSKRLAALDPASREKDALKIMRDVLEGLSQMHSAVLLHRDVKLKNVLKKYDPVTKQSRFVLCDFGLTRPFRARTDRSFVTVCGSSDHIAPEILGCRKLSGGKSDLYSLGVMLYHVLFPDNDGYFDPAAFRQQKAADFPFSPEVKALLLNLTKTTPADRPSSAAALIEAKRLLIQHDAEYLRSVRQQVFTALTQSQQPDPGLMAALPESEAAHLLRACSAALTNNSLQMMQELLRGASVPDNGGCALYYLAVFLQRRPAYRRKAAALFHLAARRGYGPADEALHGKRPDSALFLRGVLLGL